MKKYKITIAYDGTAYYGWQIQQDTLTVAGTLEKVFKDVFHQSIILVGASRTDAGVHALGAVAHFSTGLKIQSKDFLRAWQAHLPNDILIRSLDLISDEFHARYDVKYKVYYYHFFIKRPMPFVARYGFFCRKELDMGKLKDCLQIFVGKHDFRSFCTGNDHDSTVRIIDSIDLIYVKKIGAYRIKVQGPGFLRYMIRRIVGACLHVAAISSLHPASLCAILKECDPLQLLPTAPAHGLLLRKIKYKI